MSRFIKNFLVILLCFSFSSFILAPQNFYNLEILRRVILLPQIFIQTNLPSAEDINPSYFSHWGGTHAYVINYELDSQRAEIEPIKLNNPHPFGYIPENATPGVLFISDLHGTALAPLGIIRTSPRETEVIGVGDILDRGPSVENALNLVDELVLGDHDVWAIGAAIGNKHLLTLWVRMCYRNPPNEELLKRLGIDLSKFEEFARGSYVPLLAQSIAEKKNEDVRTWMEKSPEELIKAAREEKIIQKRGPKSIYEMAALNLHLKVNQETKEEIRQIEELAKQGDKKAQEELQKLRMVLLPGPNGSLAELTDEENQIVEDFKNQFLNSEKVHEFIKKLVEKAEVYKIVNLGGRKVLVLHGIIPMDEDGNLASLPCYDGLKGMALLEKMQRRFTELKRIYKRFIETGDGTLLEEFRDELTYWGDNVNSPLFPRQQTRLIHSYLNPKGEPDNPAYKIFKNPLKGDELLEKLGVDMMVLGHHSQKDGRVRDLSGIGKILIIDGAFSKKGGEVGATETGAGLYISNDGKKSYALHLLKITEALKSGNEEIKNILLQNLTLADIGYYELKDLKLKEFLLLNLQNLPILKGLEELCNEHGKDYNQIIENSDRPVIEIIKEILNLPQETASQELYKKLGSPYPTRFVLPAAVRGKEISYPELGIEFRHFDYKARAEVAITVIDPDKGLKPVILVDDKFNNRVYANRKDRVIEFQDDEHRINLPFNEMGAIRENMPTIEEFVENYQTTHFNKKVVVVFPASNVLWNDWFVAYSGGKLYHRLNEPVERRGYSVFLVKEDGGIEIRGIRIERENGNVKIIDTTTGNAIENVACFTFGQQILKNGEIVDVQQISHQFDDLRHLIRFPEIRTPNKNLDYGGTLFFGQSELLEDRSLVNKALNGETIIIPDTSIRDNIELYDSETKEKLPTRRCILSYREIEKMLENAGYQKVDTLEELRETGQFYYDRNKGKVHIKFKRSFFSHTAIGLTENGRIIVVNIGALKMGGGVTVEEVAEILKQNGAVNGLLLCNGLDVALKLNDQRIFSAEERPWGQRKKFSSVILLVK